MENDSANSLQEHITRAATVPLFGLEVHNCTMQMALDEIDRAIGQRNSLSIGMLNAAKIINMRKNQELHESVVSSNLIMADGASVVLASKMLQQPLAERVAGIDLMYQILQQGALKNYRIYCLGATKEILLEVKRKIASQYPGVVLAGAHHGYYSTQEESDVVLDIARSKADVLLVAMTSPKKERFMAKYNHMMKVPVVHGVGGSFDVFAGKVQRAPIRWQQYGLEWLYRLKQEPRRLFYRYLVTNSAFILLVLKELLHPSPTQKSNALKQHGLSDE